MTADEIIAIIREEHAVGMEALMSGNVQNDLLLSALMGGCGALGTVLERIGAN